MRPSRFAMTVVTLMAGLAMSAHAEQDNTQPTFSTSLIDALQIGGGTGGAATPGTPKPSGTIVNFVVDLNTKVMYAVMSDGSKVPMNSPTTTTTPPVLVPVSPAVPEPGTAALMGLGLAAIVLRVARRGRA